MAGHGLAERRATLARLKSLAGGRVWQGSVDDDEQIPRNTAGEVLPHIVVSFGTPVRSARDRNIANPDKGQPHILPAQISCVASDADTAQGVMADVFDLLVDWAPSATSDAWESKNGYTAKRDSTANAPSRKIEGLFLETVVNNGVDGDA